MNKMNISKPTEYSLIDNNKKYLPSRFVFVPTICLTSNSETIENAIAEQTYYNVENDDFVCKITHKDTSESSSRIVCKANENNVYVCRYTKSDGGIEYVACFSKKLELDNVLTGQNFNATNVMVKMSHNGQDVALDYFYDTSGDESLKHTQIDNGTTPYIQVPINYDSFEINTNNIFYKDEMNGYKKTYVIMKPTENDKVKVITNLSKKDSVLTRNEDGDYKINDLDITLSNTLKNEIDSGYLNYLFVMEGYYVANQLDPKLTLERYKEMKEISDYVNNGFNEIEKNNTDYDVWSCIDEVEKILKKNIIEEGLSEDAFGALNLVSQDLTNFKSAKKHLDICSYLQNASSSLEKVYVVCTNNTDLQNAQSKLEDAQNHLSFSASNIQQLVTQINNINTNLQDASSSLEKVYVVCTNNTDLQNAQSNLEDAQSKLEDAQSNLQNAKLLEVGNKPQFLANIESLKNWFNENILLSIYSENNFLGNVYKSEAREISAYWNEEFKPDNKTRQICNNFEKNLSYLDTEKNMIVAENDGNCELIYLSRDSSNRDRLLPDGDNFLTNESTNP